MQGDNMRWFYGHLHLFLEGPVGFVIVLVDDLLFQESLVLLSDML